MNYELKKKQDPEKVGLCSICGERFAPKVAPKDRDEAYFRAYANHQLDKHMEYWAQYVVTKMRTVKAS